MNQQLDDLYINSPVSSEFHLTGDRRKLIKYLQQRDVKFKSHKVVDYLSEQEPYTLNRRSVQNFKRNAYFINRPLDLIEADLIDLSQFAEQNDGYKYILTYIDTFTKKANAKAVKNKNAETVVKAVREIMDEEGNNPKALQTDRGLEFKNKIFKGFLSSRNIKQNFPFIPSAFKASICEIFNRTLRTKIFRYFTSRKEKNYRRYIDVLSDIVESYNNSVHSSTLMRPNEITLADVCAESLYKYTSSSSENTASLFYTEIRAWCVCTCCP